MAEELEKLSEETEELTEQEAEFLDEETEVDSTTSELASNEVSVPSGQAMKLDEVIRFTAKKHHKIILIAGTKESGKTSLIANYFLDFQLGKHKEFKFAGSHTLVGFEQRCWKFRTASMRMKPKTTRTNFSDSPYLHLQVSNEQKQANDLLFCDIAGEKFKNAANSTEWANKLNELHWANHFVLLVDGLSMCLLDKRQSQSARIQHLLYRLIDSGMLTNRTSIEIVFSKADLFNKSKNEIEKIAKLQDEELDKFFTESSSVSSEKLYNPSEADKTKEFIEDLKMKISSKLDIKGCQAKFFYTSAYNIYSAKKDEFDNIKLFNYWLNKFPDINSRIERFNPETVNREIYKFQEREMSRTK